MSQKGGDGDGATSTFRELMHKVLMYLQCKAVNVIFQFSRTDNASQCSFEGKKKVPTEVEVCVLVEALLTATQETKVCILFETKGHK